MRVVLLGPASSLHLERWANALCAAGDEVHVVSVHRPEGRSYAPTVKLHVLSPGAPAGYFLAAGALRALLRKLSPDVVNAHYATGYGTLAHFAVARAQYPYVLNVWGSDVFSFPRKSPLHRAWVRANLRAAHRIGSTSRCMAEETNSVARATLPITVTPFGIDTEQFRPSEISGEKKFVLGTAKALLPGFGHERALRLLRLLRDEGIEAELETLGDGPLRPRLERLAAEGGLSDYAHYRGAVAPREVAAALARWDVYLGLSETESFGVAALEAMASGVPPVVTDAPGFREVVVHGQTGFVLPMFDDPVFLSTLRNLATDASLRRRLGAAGRARVEEQYDLASSVRTLRGLYRDTIAEHGKNLAKR